MGLAYIDPGSGMVVASGIGTLIASIAAIFGAVLWRIRRLFTRTAPDDRSTRLWLRPWMLPLLCGLPPAFVYAYVTAWPAVRDNAYIQWHFYNTAFRLLALGVNDAAWRCVGVVALLVLAWWLGGQAPARVGRILRVALTLAETIILAVVWLHNDPVHRDYLQVWLAKPERAVMAFIVGPSGLIAALALLIIGLLSYQARQQRRDRPVRPQPDTVSASAAAPRRPSRLLRVLDRAVVALTVVFVVAWLGVNLAALTCHASAAAGAKRKPNIIFIMVDTLRVDHVGCYGYDLPVTPNIDAFAAESTRFSLGYAQSSWTIWSVGSMMTSRHPDLLFPPQFTPHPKAGVNLYYPTIAEALRDQGYTTSAIISNPMLHDIEGNHQGYDVYDDRPTLVDKATQPTSPLVTQAALKRLAELKGQRFFLYLLYDDPHDPYYHQPAYDRGVSKTEATVAPRLAQTNAPARMAERRKKLSEYDSEIALTDAHIGELITGLKAQGLYDDTLIVFWSDHGEEFLDHGNFFHMYTLYSEVTQVPFVVKLPGQHAGRTVDGAFPLIDVYPSVMKLLGAPYERLGLQGDAVNFAGVQRCADKPLFSATIDYRWSVRSGGHEYIFTDLQRKEGLAPVGPPTGAAGNAFTLMYMGSGANRRPGQQISGSEVYDLKHDPRELFDLSASRADIAQPLADLLKGRDANLLPTDRSIHPFGVSEDGVPDTTAGLQPLKPPPAPPRGVGRH